MNNLQNRDKQTRFSIRKYSVGVFSVSVATLYFLAGGNALAADNNAPRISETSSGAPGNSTDSETTPKEKENNETLATNNTKPVENKEALNGVQPTEASTSANTRGRRVRRDAPTGETSGNSTGTETPAGSSTGNNESLNSAVTERKGSTVQPDQPGINIPKGEEPGAHDPNAHLKFDDPKEDATVEEMWKIIQHMPDDFQNNERSYLRNMDTLGRELRFDKTAENPEGVPLQPGEIRELHDFGGWHAIDKDGNKGKFAIGRKNAQGYFTGWHKVGQTENGIPIIEQGGMLGADALDNIYVHEQALDRRFDYMLMLVKGRTRANRNDTVADNSTYDPRAQNERAETAGANYNKLPFLEKDKFNKYSPGVVGYNGIEKKFTAFSTKYGSRVRVDFVTGYITDINGSKGSYRVVIKAQNSKGEETKVYDETISRVAEIVQNEELYKKGLNVESAHESILKFLKGEFEYRVNKIKNPKVKANSLLRGTKEKDYTPEQQKVYDQIVEEATEEAKKQGDIVMNVTEDFLSIAKSGKKDSEWKKTFTNTSRTTPGLSNDLNNLLKNADKDNPNTPTWLSSGSSQAKADDRAYRLLTTLIPGAKKITYHVNDDQLEVETDKYTYTAARNGSKEVGIQGSNIAATLSADAYGANPQTFDRENTNTKANNLNHGWARSSSEEFKHFSKFLGVDKGIVRTNVISDEELSAKIKEAVGPGYSKLGKAGYFSTADIPLGTDIVSYTVQVIPSDNERVGVNPQSSRIQYNMPILADFSVIQDTTEPSKEVARRIITKLKEQGKITGDQEKKIKEEIDKVKKTSELRSAMSGDVIVRYVDTDGNNLPISDADAKKAGEKTDNGYLVRKDVLIGTDYDVNSKKVPSFNATNGKNYALRSVGGGLETSSDAPSGSITKKNTVITFVYEERTAPPTGKGVVHFKKQVSETVTEPLTGYGDITLEGNVGETFSPTDVDTRITALKNAGYEIVTNEFDTNSKTIDSTTDEDGQEPSQVYNVIVREKVETVTTPPTPDTPVDPSVPEGPKWPETGLKESDLKKEVTRTINYFKKETADGEKIANAQPTKVDTVLYKRTATYNLVSKEVTYSGWTATADDTHTATSFSPVKTPVLTGYVADFKEVTDAPAAPTANGEVTNMTREVVYTKLGSWVPKIPGKTPTPIPYPNDPNDATKPKYPDYPKTPENPGETPNPQPETPGGSTPGGGNETPGGETPGTPGGGNETPGGETPGTPEKPKTPELPVIPYEPGYTPGIPTDPTQPVDPKTNPLVPLKPVDPKDPKKGYKVPEIPKTPGNDTPITYEANPQKALVKVVKVEGEGENKTETPLKGDYVNINGKTGEEIPDESVTAKIADLEKRGYVVENKDLLNNQKFDNEKDPTDGDPTQVFKLLVKERTVEVTEPKNPNDPVDPNKPEGPKWPETGLAKSDLEKEVTRTITYVKKETADGPEIADAKPTKKQTAHFKRSATYNLVTKVVTPGEWTSTDKTLEAVPTEKLDGYVANVPSVEEVETNANSTNLDRKVVYTKLGSWVPKVPGVETPTPLPYPNHPTDPTKPGDPTDPNTPNVPVIPYVPGYTPKIGETPLQPKVPNDPTQGYIPPAVPTEPGNDTPITYEKVPDKPKPETTGTKEVTRTIKYVDEKGNELAKPSTDKVTFKGNGSDWKAVGGDSTFDAVKSPVVKGYLLKDANQKEVSSATVKSDAKDETITVTYTKVGSYVPKVPEGVTPPSPTPYDNDPEDPTKVVTPNPEKPQDPKDPNSPKVPVLPQVPGHTPVVPKDPTKPVSPENPLVPLTPVDPNHPEKGYNVPPVPTIPGQDTPIMYVKDGQQKAITSFVDPKGNVLETPIIETGDSNTPLTKDGEIKATIAKLKLKGYDVETNTYPPKGTFDNDPKVDQYFKVTLTPRVKPVKPFDPTNPKDPNKPVPGQPIDPDTPVDPNNPNDPTIPRWTEDLINKLETTKQVTRTINYVDEEGNKVSEPSTDKVTFTREAKINVVTGEITYGDWKAVGGDSTFDAVKSPVVKGYILKDPAQKVVEKETVKSDAKDEKITVTYTKVGSFVPKVPEGVTPKTPLTPTPYDNDPEDPTKVVTPNPEKPQDPKDPNSPKVPVIPYVPGHTPVVPKDPTKPVSPENPLVPLTPVDPNHPEKGYNVPPVPTEPGKDTPIEYVKVPNTPSPEEPVKPTPESNRITIWVDENGNPIKPDKPGTHESGKIPGYRFITTTSKDGVTVHKFEKITPVDPNKPTPENPTTPNPEKPGTPTPGSPTIPNAVPGKVTEKQQVKRLANTGETETNTGLAGLGLAMFGMALAAIKRRKDK